MTLAEAMTMLQESALQRAHMLSSVVLPYAMQQLDHHMLLCCLQEAEEQTS